MRIDRLSWPSWFSFQMASFMLSSASVNGPFAYTEGKRQNKLYKFNTKASAK